MYILILLKISVLSENIMNNKCIHQYTVKKGLKIKYKEC